MVDHPGNLDETVGFLRQASAALEQLRREGSASRSQPQQPVAGRHGPEDGPARSGPVNCTFVLRRGDKPYPRTCERCGLGPCPFYNNDGSAKR